MRGRKIGDGVFSRIRKSQYTNAGIPKAKEKYIYACIPRIVLSIFSMNTKHSANNKKAKDNKKLNSFLFILIEAYIPIEKTSNLSIVQDIIPIGDIQSNPTKGLTKIPFRKKRTITVDIEIIGQLSRHRYRIGDIR